jgi:insertion element IS1 protein InsB
MHECPTYQSDRVIKHGSAAGKPKKPCQPCGDPLTRTTPRGKPLKTRVNAVLCYLSGLSMNRIACLLRVSAQAVLNGIRAFAIAHSKKPEPTGNPMVWEPDEMWHDLQRKRRTLWIWKALDRDTEELLDGACGRRDKTTLKKLVDRLVPWDVKRYGTDQGATYASVIPLDTLVQSKAMTQAMERHHGRPRHWFGRLKRQSIIISKSKEMVDLTMALFATF